MNQWNEKMARVALRAIFDAAVASADPAEALMKNLPEKPLGRCVVVGAGKAAAAMAAALEAAPKPNNDTMGCGPATTA